MLTFNRRTLKYESTAKAYQNYFLLLGLELELENAKNDAEMKNSVKWNEIEYLFMQKIFLFKTQKS